MSLTPPCRAALGLALALAVAGCADLTEPGSGAPPLAAEAPTAKEAEAEAAPTPAQAPAPAAEERVAASHVLIQYKGSMRAGPDVKRSKDEARKLATEVMNKAKKGQDFAGL